MILGVLLLLLLNGCFLLPRYGSVEGHVYVPESPTEGKSIILRDSPQAPAGYKPLVGATVGVEGSSNTTTTDIYGYFILIDISIGTIIINITPPSGSGYQPLIISVEVILDSIVDIGNDGSVSLPSENADYWDVTINRIDTSNWPEVRVYVQVIDPINNSPIIGANDFEVDINGYEIGSLTVQSAGDSASSSSSSSLVIDRSGSMSGTELSDAKDAAKTFVGFMTANDRAEVVSFSNNVRVDQEFTNDKSALDNAIDSITTYNMTALYDGIWKGLDDTNLETNERKAVIVLTDGQENWSSSEHGGGSPPDNSDVIGHANDLNIPIYTIGLGLNKREISVEEGARISRDFDPTEDLQQIAEDTGGEFFDAPTSTDLEYIYVQITQRIQQQYIITFTDNTGITDGILTVKINYSQISGEASKDYEPFGDVVYRALLVGVGDYIYFPDGINKDLSAPSYDVDRMQQTLEHCKFGESNIEFAGNIYYWKDHYATKSNILGGINAIFSKADSNDISYFYFSGHGGGSGSIYYICPADTSSIDSIITVDELETALSAIPGTKVVFLDTCHSGGFIGKRRKEIIVSREELESFNDEIINIFSQAQSKGLLTTNQYKVLTACASDQLSWEVDPLFGNPYGYFTKALCEGCGYDTYNHPYPADTNKDTKVSLQEAYIYIKDSLSSLTITYEGKEYKQDVQAWPEDSSFTIVEY